MQTLSFYTSLLLLLILGQRAPLDFVGNIDNLINDWQQLLPALDAAHLSPSARRELILEEAIQSNGGHAGASDEAKGTDAQLGLRVRRGPAHPTKFVPGYLPSAQQPRWTLEDVLLVCRRYLQDLACFDFAVPMLCIQYVDLIYDGRFEITPGS